MDIFILGNLYHSGEAFHCHFSEMYGSLEIDKLIKCGLIKVVRIEIVRFGDYPDVFELLTDSFPDKVICLSFKGLWVTRKNLEKIGTKDL
jgi:hypothetical protein